MGDVRMVDLNSALTVGQLVYLHPLPTVAEAPRHVGYITGWQESLYILLDVGCPTARAACLATNQLCAARFLRDGTAYGFTATIESLTGSAARPSIQLSWPQRVETVQVRRHERIPVTIRCGVIYPNGACEEEEMRDLSSGGCLLHCSGASRPNVDDVLRLSFTLPDGHSLDWVEATVRSVAASGTHWTVGCAFGPLDDELQRPLDCYVAATLEHLAPPNMGPPSILVIEQRRDVVRYLSQNLRARGYDVGIAITAVDAFHRLRVHPPDAVLISHEQTELSSRQLCRLIAQSQRRDGLPIFVYGGDEQVADQVMDAGAVDCFDSAYDIETILATLEQHVRAPEPVT